MSQTIDLRKVKSNIHPALLKFQGKGPKGNQLSFTNRYMVRNGHPFFGICGEFHFSRYNHEDWETELIKMKMNGINIISTYIIWNHHEEIKGQFDWSGNKNLRRFIELCKKHNLDVIVRIGPWVHGEVRNGGFPDWLYAEPLVVRSNNELYLKYVQRFYEEIGEQLHALFYKDGGPIIGIQLENEFQHAGAAWEITTGTSEEWTPAGSDGNEHIKKLKQIAKDAGMIAPIYTGTGWGGAVADTNTVLPLWGGYAFWPWIFYDPTVKEHPATPEYIYRDYRYPTYNFDPKYDPKEIPFACCEMGGGMTVFYSYRFQLPYPSVDAMTNVKVASGCNFIGYYVFHGGTNPLGKQTPFLNENATPKVSYDYQAPLGEFGQTRESYYRLKRQHYFFTKFQDYFCQMETVLPVNAQKIDPTDTDTLRYSVRQKDNHGYVFINNYQDHVECKEKKNQQITLKLDNESLNIPHTGTFSLAAEENCILPFNLDIEGITLKTATAQLITKINNNGHPCYFFYSPKGMLPEYVFSKNNLKDLKVSAGNIVDDDNLSVVTPKANELSKIIITDSTDSQCTIYTLTSEQSLNFWSFQLNGEETVLLTDQQVLVDQNGLRFESENHQVSFSSIDNLFAESNVHNAKKIGTEGLLTNYTVSTDEVTLPYTVNEFFPGKLTINIDTTNLNVIKDALIKIDYTGDIGYAFYNDKLINDNYCNGSTWEIGLQHNLPAQQNNELYINITPLKKGHSVKSDSPMAARSEENDEEIVDIKKVSIKPFYTLAL